MISNRAHCKTMNTFIILNCGGKCRSYRKVENDRWRHICSNEHSWPDCKGRCCASTTIFLWLYWQDTLLEQSEQLCSIGADMTSATSLSLSIYNLLLYGSNPLLLLAPNTVPTAPPDILERNSWEQIGERAGATFYTIFQCSYKNLRLLLGYVFYGFIYVFFASIVSLKGQGHEIWFC